MDSIADSKLEYGALSSINLEEEAVSKVQFTVKVTFELALAVVNEFVFTKQGRHLSEAEILILKGAWNDEEYEEIVKNSTYSLNYLQRGLACRLWNMLSETIGNGERIGKKNLRIFLEQVTEEYYARFAPIDTRKPNIETSIQFIGRKPPDTFNFYGRTKELAHLQELIIKERCVLLVGVAGIGKTALATKLISNLSVESKPRFDQIIWKSFSHVPLLHNLVSELIGLIYPSELESETHKNTQEMISFLIKQLQSSRCLLVFDALECLFQKNNFQKRLEYSLFFRQLIDELNESCLLLTTRSLPDELDDLIEVGSSIREIKIEGLDIDAAMHFLSSEGIKNQEHCNELIQIYRGNPSELQAVVKRINQFFAGNSERFLENKSTLVSRKIEVMLDHMFGELLSPIQCKILTYIAEKIISTSHSVSFRNLLIHIKDQQNNPISTLELIKALEKLERQSLLESIKDPVTKEISFNLQPVVKKYITTDPQGLVKTSNTSHLAIAS